MNMAKVGFKSGNRTVKQFPELFKCFQREMSLHPSVTLAYVMSITICNDMSITNNNVSLRKTEVIIDEFFHIINLHFLSSDKYTEREFKFYQNLF